MVRLGRSYPVSRVLRPVAAAAKPPPVYDAIGTFGNGAATWNHTAAAGAYALAFITSQSTSTTVSALKYGSTAMTLLTSVTDAGGFPFYLYGLNGVAGSAQTLTLTYAGNVNALFSNSISFKNVTSAGTPTGQNVSAAATSWSQPVTCPPGSVIVQGWEDGHLGAMTAVGGGTNKFSPASSFGILSISYASTTTTFTATLSSADTGYGLAVALAA